MNALKNGFSIVVDVNGVIGGLNKQNPKDFQNKIVCNISNPEIMEEFILPEYCDGSKLFGVVSIFILSCRHFFIPPFKRLNC